MCMAAPGPRCANDIKKSLAKNKDRRAALAANGTDEEINAADSERHALLFELAGTRTGQADLNKRIAAEPDLVVKEDLETYRDRAREAYVEKVERLRTVEAALVGDDESDGDPNTHSDDEHDWENCLDCIEDGSNIYEHAYNPSVEIPSQRIVRNERGDVETPPARRTSAASYNNGKGGKGGTSSAAPKPATTPVQETFRPPHNHDTFRSACSSDCPRLAYDLERAKQQALPQSRTSSTAYTRKGGK